MRWSGGRWTRFNGRRWAPAAYSLAPELLRDPARLDERPGRSDQARRRALALAVEDQVTHHGATIVLDGPSGVVLAYRRRRSLLLDGVMVVVTGGLWLGWLMLTNRQDRARLEVDPWGNVWAGPLVAA